MSRSIYVCHTFYHVFVTCLKELNKPKEERGKATLVLSTMSIKFGDLDVRAKASGLFEDVVWYDEKREDFFPELDKYRKDRGNIVSNMWNRILLTKKFAKLQAPFVPVDFRQYDEVYVFCDQDPIGYYLNQQHIRYHAVEDGLDTLLTVDGARTSNIGHFGLKLFFSEKLNLIFICNGHSKYCIDMEVNNIEKLKYKYYKYKEVPRNELIAKLTEEEEKILVEIFVPNIDLLREQIRALDPTKDNILILTEPLCTLDVRERIFQDLLAEYSKEGNVFFKPHPRDELDYKTLFAQVPQFDACVPMEILNFFREVHFKKIVSVYTELGAIRFADEKVRLSYEFMDKYEADDKHGQNRFI